MTSFTTPEAISRFQLTVLRSALKMYRDHGIKANRAYTPKAMLAKAGELTGQTFKRGQYTQAIEALEAKMREV